MFAMDALQPLNDGYVVRRLPRLAMRNDAVVGPSGCCWRVELQLGRCAGG